MADHEAQIEKLDQLGAKAIVGTRPIVTPENSRRNEAYVFSLDSGIAVRGRLSSEILSAR